MQAIPIETLTNTDFNKRKGGMNPKEVAKAIYFIANCPYNVDLFITNEKD